MKKNLLLFATALILVASACKKSNKGDDGGNPVDPNDPFQLEYSTNTVEQNKKNLEKTGVEFVQKFNTLPDEEFVEVLEVFYDLNFEGFDFEGSDVSNVSALKDAVSSKKMGMLVKAAATAAEPVRISEIYGVYTWNANTEEFEKTASSDKVEFKFPSSRNSATNDATMTFTYVAGQTSTIDGESYELPLSTVVSLKVLNKTLLSMNTSHEFKSDATPSKTVVAMSMGSFKIDFNLTNDGSNASVAYSMKKGEDALINIAASAVVGKSTITDLEKEQDLAVEDIVHNANATLEILDYKFTGKVDVKSLFAEVNAINDNVPDAEYVEKEAAAWNKHTQLVAIDKKDNKLIANIKTKRATDEYCYNQYTPTQNGGYTVQEVCKDESILIPVLVFKDGSQQQLEDYSESGFDAIIEELDKIIEKFDL